MCRKILISLFIIATALFCILPNNYKAGNETITTEEYEFNPNTGAIIYYIGEAENTDIVIPNEINEIPVKAIACSAFFMCEAKKIVIPESVETIESGAFSDCTNLKELIVAEDSQHFTSIDDVLFSKDKTLLVKYPDGKTNSTYDIPEGTTEIINSFGWIPAINKINIPSTLDVEGKYFASLPNLEEVAVSDENPYLCTVDGVLYDKEMKKLILYPRGKTDREYVIPDSIECISGHAFFGAVNLKEVYIPDSVTEIREFAFYGCNMNSIIIPENLEIIEEHVFGCTAMNRITIPDNIVEIKPRAFNGSMLVSINIPDSVTSIGEEGFAFCVILNDVVLPESIAEIKKGTFLNCDNLKEIILPENIVAIEDEAFNGCDALESIIIPDKVERIGDEAFAYCTKLKEIYIPESVVQMSDNAFKGSYRNMVIKGKSGSYAESYAIENNIKFEDPSAPPTEQEITETLDDEMIINQEENSKQISDKGKIILIGALTILIVIAIVLTLKKRDKQYF